MINIRTAREIELLRNSSQIVVEALKLAESLIEPGKRTIEIDETIAEFIYSNDARPAFKGFHGYPANTCISINNQIVHGIPGERQLQEGDIVSIDIGVEKDGYYGDAAKTFAVGNIAPENLRLMRVTQEALYKAIDVATAGNRLSDIGYAVQSHVEQAGYSVVRDLVGHGIGTSMHEAPQIPNYGTPKRGPRLKAGMVFAIEPMVNMGSHEVLTEDDDWTVVTADGKPSAHFEHDIVITDGKADILTKGI